MFDFLDQHHKHPDFGEEYASYVQAAQAVRDSLSKSESWDSWASQQPWWEVENLASWWVEHRDQAAPPPLPGYRAPQDGLPVLDHLELFTLSRGFRFPRSILASYYLALQSKPLVILSGISGTGKTKLAQLFAEFISPDLRQHRSVAGVDPSDESDLVTILYDYTVRHRKVHIPKSAWSLFPLPHNQHQTIQVETPVGSSECRLAFGNQKGVLTLFLRGEAGKWAHTLSPGLSIQWKFLDDDGTRVRLDLAPTTKAIPQEIRLPRTSYFGFVPVRPDWTDHRGLLGFHHLLTGAYHTTDFLRLLLQAQADPESRPYFVLLDEMNLARVEHYFSDFLSVLESRRRRPDGGVRQDAFPLHDQPRCLAAAGTEIESENFHSAVGDQKLCLVTCEGCPLAGFVAERHRQGELDYENAVKDGFNPTDFVPPRLEVPLNVFFTGTVNVDETTYTFSPKVLDRASVIEFKKVHLAAYYEVAETPTHAVPSATADQVEEWTQDFGYRFSEVGRGEARTDPDLDPSRVQLITLVELLEPFDLHFGYRVADKILTFLFNAKVLGAADFDLDTAFDRVLVQKILPKLHGSRARLEKPLLRLLAFCVAGPELEVLGEATRELAATFASKSATTLAIDTHLAQRYPRTAEKVLSLLEALELDGFAGSL